MFRVDVDVGWRRREGRKEGLGDVRHSVSFAADGKCDYCGKSDGTKGGQASRLGGLREREEKPPQSVMDDGAQLRRSLYFVVLSCLVCYFLESRAHYVVAAAIILLSTPDTHTHAHTHRKRDCYTHA